MNAPLVYFPASPPKEYKVPWPTADNLHQWRECAFDGDIWARFVMNIIEKAIDMSHVFTFPNAGRPIEVGVPTIVIAALWQHDHDRGFRWIKPDVWGDQIVPNGGQKIDKDLCRRLAACAADLIGCWAADEGLELGVVTKRLRDDPLFSPMCMVACTADNPAWETIDMVQQLAAEQLCVQPGMELRSAAARHEPGDDARLPRLRITLTNEDRKRLVVRPGRAEYLLVDVARIGEILASVPMAIIS